MQETRFHPSDLNDVHSLKERLFSGTEEMKQLDSLPKSAYIRPDGALYYSSLNVTWVISTIPFRIIYVVFLRSISAFLSCAYFSKASASIGFEAQSTELYSECVLTQLYWGARRLVPSFNTYSPKAKYIMEFEGIQRENLKSPFIRKHLTKLLDRVELNRGEKGLCHGSVNWFNFLFLLGFDKNIQLVEKCDTFKQYMTAIAQIFKDGQPVQAALLQSLYGIGCPLLGLKELHFKITSDYHKDRKTLVEKLNLLPSGLYHVQITGQHSLSLLKTEKELLVFDSNGGLVQFNSLDELASRIQDYSQKLTDEPIFFNLQILNKHNILRRIWQAASLRLFG